MTQDDNAPSGYDQWWVIHGEELHAALVRVSEGESPDIAYAELYANTDREAQG